MTKVLAKADLLAALSLQPVEVEIEGVGTVLMRSLSYQEAMTYRHKFAEAEGTDREVAIAAETIARCLVEPQLNGSDAEALHNAKPTVIADMLRAIFDLSGLGSEAGE